MTMTDQVAPVTIDPNAPVPKPKKKTRKTITLEVETSLTVSELRKLTLATVGLADDQHASFIRKKRGDTTNYTHAILQVEVNAVEP